MFSKANTGGAWFANSQSKSLSKDKASWLGRPFSLEDITEGPYSLPIDKAPGPVGSTMTLFQECWNKIKDDLMALFMDLYLRKKYRQVKFHICPPHP